MAVLCVTTWTTKRWWEVDGSHALMEVPVGCKGEGVVPLDQAEAQSVQSPANPSLKFSGSEVGISSTEPSSDGNGSLAWVSALA